TKKQPSLLQGFRRYTSRCV
ncbi:hypothetical protein AZ024_004657, partial [Escherichia coli]